MVVIDLGFAPTSTRFGLGIGHQGLQSKTNVVSRLSPSNQRRTKLTSEQSETYRTVREVYQGRVGLCYQCALTFELHSVDGLISIEFEFGYVRGKNSMGLYDI